MRKRSPMVWKLTKVISVPEDKKAKEAEEQEKRLWFWAFSSETAKSTLRSFPTLLKMKSCLLFGLLLNQGQIFIRMVGAAMMPWQSTVTTTRKLTTKRVNLSEMVFT